MKGTRFTETIVWQRAHEFVLAIYHLSDNFPRHEQFGLTAQMRKAAVSIPANFVEGFRRFSPAEKIRFYNVAQASGEECRYYLILSNDLGYGDSMRLMPLVDETEALLEGYIRAIRKRITTRRGRRS